MIAVSADVVTNLTGLAGGWNFEHAGQVVLMAAGPFDSPSASPASPWTAVSSPCNRSYQLAALRGAVIALVLLGILALIVLL